MNKSVHNTTQSVRNKPVREHILFQRKAQTNKMQMIPQMLHELHTISSRFTACAESLFERCKREFDSRHCESNDE